MKILITLLIIVNVWGYTPTEESIRYKAAQSIKWAINHPYGQKTSLTMRLRMLKEKRDRDIRALGSRKQKVRKQKDQSRQIKALKQAITEIDNFFISKIKKENIDGYEAFAKQCKIYQGVKIMEKDGFLQCYTLKSDYIKFLEKRVKNGNK